MKAKALGLKVAPEPTPGMGAAAVPIRELVPTSETGAVPEPEIQPGVGTRTFRIHGNVPPEIWNRLGTKILPKLRSGSDLKIGIDFSVTVDGAVAGVLISDLCHILDDLGLSEKVDIQDF